MVQYKGKEDIIGITTTHQTVDNSSRNYNLENRLESTALSNNLVVPRIITTIIDEPMDGDVMTRSDQSSMEDSVDNLSPKPKF